MQALQRPKVNSGVLFLRDGVAATEELKFIRLKLSEEAVVGSNNRASFLDVAEAFSQRELVFLHKIRNDKTCRPADTGSAMYKNGISFTSSIVDEFVRCWKVIPNSLACEVLDLDMMVFVLLMKPAGHICLRSHESNLEN